MQLSPIVLFVYNRNYLSIQMGQRMKKFNNIIKYPFILLKTFFRKIIKLLLRISNKILKMLFKKYIVILNTSDKNYKELKAVSG